MSAIIYKQIRAFDAATHQDLARQILVDTSSSDLGSLKGSFRLRQYATTTHFSFELGWGAREPYHIDLPAYQALLIVQPNRWLLKGVKDSYKSVFQDSGDLIVLNQSRKHGIVWNRKFCKPTSPWLYLFIDAHNRRKWSKQNLNKRQAEQLALAAIRELEDPSLLNYLAAGQH